MQYFDSMSQLNQYTNNYGASPVICKFVILIYFTDKIVIHVPVYQGI